MSHKHQINPLHPTNDNITDNLPPIAYTRTRSCQRMWSDPVVKALRDELLASSHSFVNSPAHHYRPYNEISPNRAIIAASSAPIAAAVCGDIPLRAIPPAHSIHYRSGSSKYSRYNSNIINSIHDDDLYIDECHDYDPYATHSESRMMQQAPKLLTLDDYNLISLGYKPVMSRKLPWVSLTGIAISASNVISGIIPLYGYTITNGGPAWATWSYLIIGCLSIIVSLCLSELATAYPTAAGVHHWVYQLGSARRRAFMSWMVGWFTIVSSVSVTASLAFYFSTVLGQLLLSIHKISLTSATVVMFHLGVLFAWQLFNMIPVRVLGYMSTLTAFYSVGLAVALVSAILSMAEFGPSTTHIPFTAFLNYSGSSSALYAALSSTLMASFVFCPQDTVIRMAEETRRPERSMGRLMIGNSVSSLLAGLPFIIVLNYGIVKPIKGLLDEMVPGVRVIMETLSNATGTIFVSMILVAMFFAGVFRLAMASRTVYSFARDGGVPRSVYWNHLHPSRKTPERVSWLVTAACMCSIFPFFWGNTVSFQWISSLGCISANICFAIPLWMRLTHEGGLHFIPGSFSLGRLSKPLHIISIIWLVLSSLFLMLSPTYPITTNNFNYSPIVILILGFLIGISWFKARTDFTGGAKDISRASHRAPPGVFKDICTMKHHCLGDNQGSDFQCISPSYYQHLPHGATQKLNLGTLENIANRGRSNYESNHAYELEKIQQQKQQQRRHQVSLTPPKRDPLVPKKPQFQRPYKPNTGTSTSPDSDIESLPGGHYPATPGTLMTMNSANSAQSQPFSILGIPFSESPEMISEEPAINGPLSLTAVTVAGSSQNSEAHAAEKLGHSNLLLTKPFSEMGKAAAMPRTMPETSIEPLAIRRSVIPGGIKGSGFDKKKGPRSYKTDHSRTAQGTSINRNYNRPLSDSKARLPPTSPPMIKIYHHSSGSSNSSPLIRHMDSLSTNYHADLGDSEKNSPKKSRAPTPYPPSIADLDEFMQNSDHTNPISMTDQTLIQKRSSLSSDQEDHWDNHVVPSDYSMDEIVSAMGISSSSSIVNHCPGQHLLQFPTLDGYPLIKSPSTVAIGSDNGIDFRLYDDGSYLTMLPLNRTQTVQPDDNEHGVTSSLIIFESDESEVNGSNELHESYDEEYNLDHSFFDTVPKSKLHVLTPVSTNPPHGLFRLPNLDISINLKGSYENETSTIGTSDNSENSTARPFQFHQSKPLVPSERHRDPIEQLLLVSGDQRQHNQPQSIVRQQFQRTQSVASWAKDQAIFHELRAKHRARSHALKELRKYNPTATLSNSSDSFSTSFSDLSENSPSAASLSRSHSQNQSRSSSGGAGVGVGSVFIKSERFRKQSLTSNRLQSLQEIVPLRPNQLELVVRTQEEEEEPGIYVDTDDLLSPTIEVESIGAGVGKPSYRI